MSAIVNNSIRFSVGSRFNKLLEIAQKEQQLESQDWKKITRKLLKISSLSQQERLRVRQYLRKNNTAIVVVVTGQNRSFCMKKLSNQLFMHVD